jgi:hypothetical protein
MKRIISEELLRAFRNHRFILVMLLALASFVIGNYRSPLLTFSPDLIIHPVNRLLLNLNYGGFGFLAALLAALPFADSFLADRDQGFLRMIILRTPYHRYLIAKVLAVALAGGASLLISEMIVFLLGLASPADWSSITMTAGVGGGGSLPTGPLRNLYALNPLIYLLYLLVSAFGFGAMCALLGLAASSIIHNRYVALAAPLVFVQLLSFIEERSLRLTPAFNPINSLLPFTVSEYSGNFTLGDQLAQITILVLLALVCFFALANKKRIAL